MKKTEKNTVKAEEIVDTIVTADTPATDKPATDKPATDKPATDKPATDTPATDTPATDTPATDKPATDVINDAVDIALKAAGTAVSAYSAAINHADEATKFMAADEAVNTLNAVIKAAAYGEWLKAENPFEAAIRELFVTEYKITTSKDKDGKPTSATLKSGKVIVDLQDFENSVKDRKLANHPNWVNDMSKLRESLILRAYYELYNGSEAEKKTAVKLFATANNISTTIESNGGMPKDALSMTTLKTAIQDVVNKILFIPREDKQNVNSLTVTKAEVWFILLSAFAYNRRTGVITCPRDDTMRAMVTQVVHFILTGNHPVFR